MVATGATVFGIGLHIHAALGTATAPAAAGVAASPTVFVVGLELGTITATVRLSRQTDGGAASVETHLSTATLFATTSTMVGVIGGVHTSVVATSL